MTFTKPKKVSRNLQGDVTDIKNDSKKSKPRDVPYENFLNMVRARDRIWYAEGKFVEFLKQRYGIK